MPQAKRNSSSRASQRKTLNRRAPKNSKARKSAASSFPLFKVLPGLEPLEMVEGFSLAKFEEPIRQAFAELSVAVEDVSLKDFCIEVDEIGVVMDSFRKTAEQFRDFAKMLDAAQAHKRKVARRFAVRI